MHRSAPLPTVERERLEDSVVDPPVTPETFGSSTPRRAARKEQIFGTQSIGTRNNLAAV